jgi:putative transcriptional regulator
MSSCVKLYIAKNIFQELFNILNDFFALEKKMVRCHLSRMMGERKMKIVDVARETGLHRNTITLLYNETATRIDLETIDGLCKLFGCKVGDLFEFTPSNSPSDNGHEEQ